MFMSGFLQNHLVFFIVVAMIECLNFLGIGVELVEMVVKRRKTIGQTLKIMQ